MLWFLALLLKADTNVLTLLHLHQQPTPSSSLPSTSDQMPFWKPVVQGRYWILNRPSSIQDERKNSMCVEFTLRTMVKLQCVVEVTCWTRFVACDKSFPWRALLIVRRHYISGTIVMILYGLHISLSNSLPCRHTCCLPHRSTKVSEEWWAHSISDDTLLVTEGAQLWAKYKFRDLRWSTKLPDRTKPRGSAHPRLENFKRRNANPCSALRNRVRSLFSINLFRFISLDVWASFFTSLASNIAAVSFDYRILALRPDLSLPWAAFSK